MPPIAVLPSLVTLGNAVCGFISIAIVATAAPLTLRDGLSQDELTPYFIAGYLIFLAMVFDALDGRVARYARVTSDFGGQLDSLCDAISFGVAPALLGYCIFKMAVPTDALMVHRLAMVMAIVFFGCAVLRLARFNVENKHDEEAHLSFRGLPSPAAAGALVSLLILLLSLWGDGIAPRVGTSLLWSIPVVSMVLGLLMTSRIRYLHLLNHLIRGRRPLSYLVQIVICLLMVLWLKERALAALFLGYAVSGPVIMIYRKLSHAGRTVPVTGDAAIPGKQEPKPPVTPSH